MGPRLQPIVTYVNEHLLALEQRLESEAAHPRERMRSILAKGWDRVAVPVRRVLRPTDTFVVGVGGATLGGSCKTSVAIAVARELEILRAISGTYIAHSNNPRHDEVLLAESKLGRAAKVALGESWDKRLSQASSWAVADGLLQTKPTRLDLSVLAVDAFAPLGNNLPPPLGNRRHPLGSLLEACDVVVAVADRGDEASTPAFDAFVAHCVARNMRVFRATRTLHFEDVDPNALRRMRLGLVTYLSRPDRFLRSLAKLGIFPLCHRRGRDHGRGFGKPPPARSVHRFRRGEPDPTVEGWVCSEKCRFSVAESLSPLFVARETIEFSPDFRDFLVTIGGRAHA